MNKERTKKLLMSALEAAIQWEETLHDANAEGDKEFLLKLRNNVKGYNALLKIIAPNRPMTMRQYLESFPDDMLLTLDEIKERHRNESKDGK